MRRTRWQKLARSLEKPWRHRARSVGHGFKRLFAPTLTAAEWALHRRHPRQAASSAPRLSITLTSYAPRFGTLALTLQSLLNQSAVADEVVLWVHAPELRLLPESVTRLQKYGLRIVPCERDLRVYLKSIPALRSEPNTVWVTADDDVRYPRDWLASLLAGHRADPAAVICRRAHLMKFDAAGRPLPYRSWAKQTHFTGPDAPLFVTGVGGVLYPPGCLHADATDEQRFASLSPNADDIWLNWMLRLQGTRVRRVGDNAEPVTWLSSQRVTLFKSNARGSNNDECLVRMTEAYGFCCFRALDSRSSVLPVIGLGELEPVQSAVDALLA
ncbi:MAG: glycosyltransferase family 2 protein [Methylibium sp.]|nr:glycosyltransferase family 2 protein [Methylibium sp.]